MKLHKWNIQFLGQRQYLAPDLETARKMAMGDIAVTPSQLGISINGYMDLGPVGEEE
tara:strand:- start:247 stop:417 length:171 start_codon:yes stop_codon:yes gene_type:complete